MSSSIIALRLVVRRTLQCFIVWNQFVSQKEHQTGNWWDPYKLLHPIPSYHKTFTPKLDAKLCFSRKFVPVGNDNGANAERNGFVFVHKNDSWNMSFQWKIRISCLAFSQIPPFRFQAILMASREFGKLVFPIW